MSSTVETTAGRPGLRIIFDKTCKILRKEWLYIGIGIFLAIINLILGIVSLSYIHPKKDPLAFGIICLNVLLSLSHFTSLCYLLQRAKEEIGDRPPSYLDTGYAIGVVLLFLISAIASTLILPSRCYSGPNEHFKALGQVACNLLTVKAVFSWLGVLTMIIGSITIFIASREVIEHAKLPPPVLSGDDSEAPGMRWVGRDDPFITIEERRYPNV